MKPKQPLLKTNKYLRDPKLREEMIIRHAAASAKIEGVRDAKKRAAALAKKSRRSR